MKIATWNVNSVRARQERLLEWLKSAQPDVVCLQELKCTEADFPLEAVRDAGYHAALHGQKTYNGVAILAKEEPRDVVKGLSDGVDDTHARLIAATVKGVRVVSAYAPNGQSVDSPQYEYKLEWYGRLRRYLDTRHKPDEPLVLGGDWNVAPEDIDTYDPKLWEGQTLFTLKERDALQRLRAFGLTDAYRKLHPDTQRFSWWDYRNLGFPKNLGLRIDHLYVSAPLVPRLTGADTDRDARKGKQPSDHAPVWLELQD
ncbi:exodeoxyribonuclease III [Myxococcus sp. MISCRS1]|uniref:exodeoxyribonuclease III n=1 Tax=unclassified Myxococcus TaxID=2648731 RepID=UPI001CBFAB05|nr:MULTISPECIES: exodeoxyribonuclease III [unclassified Myxococcus]MBZ4406899.1 exodeoxyribonuclease III [Myxococcus sp. XM-1-1-1]MCY1002088.1 exodeoxyribonuclease III [Myxococcus sp. MISCRS1]